MTKEKDVKVTLTDSKLLKELLDSEKLTDEEVDDFQNGVRYFRTKTYTVKVRVNNHLLPLPE